MAYSSDHEGSLPARTGKPDPFASLTGPTERRRRFWLFELLMTPFQDHDERASYHIAGKASEAQNSAAIRVSKAWNGNGNPNAVERPAPNATQAGFAPARQGGLFSSADRRPAGH
ncbi:MAG TPA: hypothetical protein VHW66_06235 [Stellaceae bacterium]|jgi:hypothetical protein|nr:hypothetical protein [Stellaceae bacterium]